MYFDSEILEIMIDDLKETGSEFEKKYNNMNKKIAEIVNSSNLISYFPLLINDKMNVSRLLSLIDKANGYYYYIESTREKFADLRDAVFDYNEIDNDEFIMGLEEQMEDSVFK